MDVYIADDENTVYDVEMQTGKKRHFGKRFRYYQGAIDVDIVRKGESVGSLRQATSFSLPHMTLLEKAGICTHLRRSAHGIQASK